MALLTVLGNNLAKEGEVFIFLGPLSDCKGCKVKNICFHLEPGRWYKVVGLRNVKHDCAVHEEGVRVVEVESVPIEAALGKKKAIEGSTITFEPPRCRNVGCKNRMMCFPPGMETGGKLKVVKVGKEVECPNGYTVLETMLG